MHPPAGLPRSYLARISSKAKEDLSLLSFHSTYHHGTNSQTCSSPRAVHALSGPDFLSSTATHSQHSASASPGNRGVKASRVTVWDQSWLGSSGSSGDWAAQVVSAAGRVQRLCLLSTSCHPPGQKNHRATPQAGAPGGHPRGGRPGKGGALIVYKATILEPLNNRHRMDPRQHNHF